jgi:hypothetical protein
MKPIVRRTATLAILTGAFLLSAHAGHCGTINPQPLPPVRHPDIIRLLLSLLHLAG